jgi:glucokinase
MRPDLVLGVDVGGTKTAALLVDGEDRVIARGVTATRHDALGDGIVALARDVLLRAEVAPSDVTAVGVGIPGHVDPIAGTVELAVNVARLAQPVAGVVERAFEAPCFIDHDARAAARRLAEVYAGRHRSLAYVSIGTGISAGVVVDGRVLTGAAGMAGEIGHVVAVPDGPACACGLRGCLEAVASGPSIARIAGMASAADVFDAAASGDATARAVVRTAAAHLARGIRGLVLAFGLDLVVVGGGVARAGSTLMDPLLETLARERDASFVVRALLGPGVVRPQPADEDAGAWGAVTVARAGLRGRSDSIHPGGEEVERRDVTTQSS